MSCVCVVVGGTRYTPTRHGWFKLVGHEWSLSWNGPGPLLPGTYRLEILP